MLQSLDIALIVIVLCVSFLIALLALWVFSRLNLSPATTPRAFLQGDETSTVFLFDNEELVDATGPAYSVLHKGSATKSGWPRLVEALAGPFPQLEEELGSLALDGHKTLRPANDGEFSRLEAEWWDDLVRLELHTEPKAPRPQSDDRQAAELELDLVRQVTKDAPYLVWQQNDEGVVTWANPAYIRHAQEILTPANTAAWPPPSLFTNSALERLQDSKPSHRLMVSSPSGSSHWFECQMSLYSGINLCYAIDCDGEVHAETALRDFVQTLTKTFAQLPIGLAIFDKSRRLALFNPALTDLTNLPVDFLSARPDLNAVLDRLRDKRMIPEPKDYKSWREHLAALKAAAEDGCYEETWSLPSGRTYRITGQPHPGGAIAFQLEDITSEISLTRHFRSELELGQAVMDSVPEAIAVFSQGGPITISNDAYVQLWGSDPGTALGEISVEDAVKDWSKRCAPSKAWAEIAEFVNTVGNRQSWSTRFDLNDGRELLCRLAPLAGGATLIGFEAAGVESDSAVGVETPEVEALSD